MPFQPVPDTAETVWHFTLNTHDMVNRICYRFGGTYALSDLLNLANTQDSIINSDYKPLLPTVVQYDFVEARGLANLIDLSATSSINTGNGTGSGPCLPANSSNCITLRTGHTGRSARGRFYAMPTTEANLFTGQSFVHAYTTALVTLLNDAKIAAAAFGWTMVIVSRFSGGVLRPAGTTLPVVSVDARNDLIDSQRGRLGKGH